MDSRKFIEKIDLENLYFEIETPSGWKKIRKTFKTIPYSVYEIVLENGLGFKCADDHIVFLEIDEKEKVFTEVFVKDLTQNQKIMTRFGPKKIVEIKKMDFEENMYDISVDDEMYYGNDILHHNTTCAASYMLWRASFIPDQTILVIAHNLNQALEITSRIRFSYEEMPYFLKPGVHEYNKGSIVFDNGSRIISRAASINAARGLSISLLYIDELSFIRRKAQEEFWTSVSPTLATGGDCIITSTPGSDEDLFALLWRQAEDCYDINGNPNPGGIGKNGFKAFKAIWREHPERNEEWAKKERLKIGDAKFEREFNCNFITHSETLIDQLFLTNLIGIDPLMITGQVRWYRKPEKNRIYVIGLDPSMGTGSDPAAIEIFSVPDFEQIGEWRNNQTSMKMQISILHSILEFIKKESEGTSEVYWSIENNSVGEAALNIVEDIGEENFYGIFVSEKIKHGRAKRVRKGFNTTFKSKMNACAKLKSLVESSKLKIYSNHLIRELKYFESNGMTYRAKPGETDDLVSATLLCIRIIEQVSNWEDSVAENFKESLAVGINAEDDDKNTPLPFLF